MRPGPFRGACRPLGRWALNPDSPHAHGLVFWIPAGDLQSAEMLTGNLSTQTAGPAAASGFADVGGAVFSSDGSTQRRQIVTPTWPSTATATIVAWVLMRSVASYDGLLLGTGANKTGLHVSGAAGNPLTYNWAASSAEYDAATGLTIPLNTLFMAAVVVTSTAATVYLLQPSGVSSWTRTAAHSTKTPTSTWSIHGDPANTSRSMDGLFVDGRAYARPLSLDELKHMYAPETRWDLYAPA